MRSNPVKRALERREPTLGSWLQLGPYPALAEILASLGFDWLAADGEHSDIDVEGFTALARGMHGRGAVPLVRVRENDTLAIRQMLDAGAMGVIVPLVSSADEARRAVAAAKYPPMGVRGFCFGRMNEYGADFQDYAERANREIAVVTMVESRAAVEAIDDILSVPGLDGVLVGPYDLSGSFGVPGRLTHPAVERAVETVLDACRRHGKSAGMHLVQPDTPAIEDALRRGFTFLALGVDIVFLRNAAQAALDTARAASGSPVGRRERVSGRRLADAAAVEAIRS